MKRMCFDTESDYFKPQIGISEIEFHRECMQENVRAKRIRFDCAVVYGEAADRDHEFKDSDVDAVIAILGTADELISHSGKRHDLLVLEQVGGARPYRPFFQSRITTFSI